MNFRLTAILFGTILILGVVLLVLTLGDEKDVSTEGILEELAAVKPEQIDRVEFEREDGSKLQLVRLAKDRWEEEWDVPTAGSGRQPVKAKADPGAITELISALLKAKPTAYSSLRTNPAVHGLQPPSLRVTLRQGTERSSTLNLGDVAIDGVVFVTTSARPERPIAVPRGSLDSLFRAQSGSGKSGDLVKWAPDFRVKSVFAADTRGAGDDVSSIILGAKGKTIALNKVGNGWRFVTPAGWGDADLVGDTSPTPGTFTGVRPLLGALTSMQALSAADFVDNPSPEDLKKYGLNPEYPDLVKVELKNKDNETTVVYVGKKDSAPPAAPPQPGQPFTPPSGKVWVRVEGQPGVIRANAGDLSGLIGVIENPDPLRDRTLLTVDPSHVDGIDVTTAGQTAKLRKAGGIPEWKLYGNPAAGDPQPTGDAVRKLVALLTERRTIKGFPAGNPANFAPGEIKAEIKVWADGFEPVADPKAEPREKGKPTTLLFGKKEGDSVYVRRTLPDGTVGEFLLPEKIKSGTGTETVDLIATVAKTRLDLLDTTLKTFSPTQVSKLTVSGVASYELVKDEKKDPSTNKDRWTFEAPADQKGKTADASTVEEMLRILGTTQSVTHFVDESPTPEELIEYGFAPPATPMPMAPPTPRLKVIVALKGTDPSDKDRTYEFGKETADPNFLYARQAGRAAVFTLPRLVHDKFAKPDLRDKSIFQFDPSQITGIELTGWKATTGTLTELHFEKNKEGNWMVTKGPVGYAVDPAKIGAFLNTLNKTAVKTFLPGVPTAEQGFGDDKQKLIITLKTAAGPLIALNLGAPADGGASFYGWTSILPQTAPVFTVDAGPLKVYKESPAAFAK